MEGLPGGCNPADVLFKLAHSRGIKAPIFEQVWLVLLFILHLDSTPRCLSMAHRMPRPSPVVAASWRWRDRDNTRVLDLSTLPQVSWMVSLSLSLYYISCFRNHKDNWQSGKWTMKAMMKGQEIQELRKTEEGCLTWMQWWRMGWSTPSLILGTS